MTSSMTVFMGSLGRALLCTTMWDSEKNKGGSRWAFCVPHRQTGEETKVKHGISGNLLKARCCGKSPTSALQLR